MSRLEDLAWALWIVADDAERLVAQVRVERRGLLEAAQRAKRLQRETKDPFEIAALQDLVDRSATAAAHLVLTAYGLSDSARVGRAYSNRLVIQGALTVTSGKAAVSTAGEATVEASLGLNDASQYKGRAAWRNAQSLKLANNRSDDEKAAKKQIHKQIRKDRKKEKLQERLDSEVVSASFWEGIFTLLGLGSSMPEHDLGLGRWLTLAYPNGLPHDAILVVAGCLVVFLWLDPVVRRAILWRLKDDRDIDLLGTLQSKETS